MSSAEATLSMTINDSQPKGLFLLFFTELWERFGFYTLQAIIILFMTKALVMGDTKANLLYAAFSGLLYISPAIGGYLADNFLGFQRSITIGGILFIAGYILCAFASKHSFFIGLGLLVCANGFFKPNVSSIVGELYHENDPRRDGGFTIFYMGINLGSLFPPLICGFLIARFGWGSGFWVAAFGMAIGQIIFMLGKKQLGNRGLYPKGVEKAPPGFRVYALITAGILATIGLCQIAFRFPEETNTIIAISAGLILMVILFYMQKLPVNQRKRLLAAVILIVISVAFWSVYNQAFTSMMLFADRNMDKHMLGLPIDAYTTQFFNPFFIIVLSPILSRFWINMDTKGLNPSIQLKFCYAVFFMSATYFLLVLGTKYFNHNGFVSPWWVCSGYFLQTIGELLISPIGLAMITVLSPKNLVGMMMGVWFFAQATSFAFAGFLANLAAVPNNTSAVASLPIYTHAFMIYGLVTFAMAIISLGFVPFLTKMIGKKY